MKQLGVNVDILVHGDMLHVLQAADDLHVFEARHHGVRSLVQRLQARAAQAVDRGAGRGDREIRHQRHVTGRVEALLALLLRVAQHQVFDLGRIDARALDNRLDDGHRQVVAANVAEHALVLVRPANGGPHRIDYDGSFHDSAPRWLHPLSDIDDAMILERRCGDEEEIGSSTRNLYLRNPSFLFSA